MCDIDELSWPPCDPAPFTSVSKKSCFIIKAKSEFKVELKQFMNNFEDNYKRALAYFYAQEAEQKARKQNKLLTEYIAQLQKYRQDVKAGVVDAKRPKAPQEIYSEDPLDCVGECYSGIVTIGSVSIESETSIDLEYVEQKGLVSLDTLEILKKSSESSQSIKQISSRKFRRRVRNGSSSSGISKSSSVEIISQVAAKTLQSSKASSKVGQSTQTVEEKPIPQTSRRNLEEKRNSDVRESSSEELRLTSFDKEVQVDSDGDWSLSDYQTAGEEVSNEVTVKENSRAGDEERDVVSPKAVSKNNSASSLATNDTQITDYDEAMNKLQIKIRELDAQKKLINEKINDSVNAKSPNSIARTKKGVTALVAEENDLLNKISVMKSKLNKLDEAASEPVQLKDFCDSLATTMSLRTIEKLLKKSGSSLTTPQNSPKSQPGNSSKLFADASKDNLTDQLNQSRSRNFSQTSIFGAQSNTHQVDFVMPPNLSSPNYTRRPPRSFDTSYLQHVMSQHMQRQNTSSYNEPMDEFSLSNPAASSHASMSASYEKIIGKLLHQNGSNERTNFMRTISATNFNV